MRRTPRLPAAAVGPALAVGLAIVVAACGGSASPASTGAATPTKGPATLAATARTTGAPTAPIPTAPAPTVPAPTKIPGNDEPTPPASPGTFETPWGTAWDALPPGFPAPPGAKPADPGDPAEGPVSGAFVVGTSPNDAVATMQAGLAAAGYSTEALSGPSEDGSLVIDLVGKNPECRVQARVRKLGGTTMISVLFGAACPWG